MRNSVVLNIGQQVLKAVTLITIAVIAVPNLHAQKSEPSGLDYVVPADPSPHPGMERRIVVDYPISGTGFPALETYAVPARSFSSILVDERSVLEQVTAAYLRTFDAEEYHRLLPLSERTAYVDVPKNAKRLRSVPVRQIGLNDVVPASLSNAWYSTQDIEHLTSWYSARYDLDFSVHRLPMQNGDTMVVAHAVRRINDVVATVVLWNPTLSSAGNAMRGVESHSTSIYIEERAFRHRSRLVAEGHDALVELTWHVPFLELIQDASIRYQIDPYLIAALLQQESGFNPNAISVDSALGIAQMIPTTAAMLGVSDPFDPKEAIDGGTRYLKMMLRRYRGNVEFALAAYNAGPGAVDKYNGVPPFAETQDYVRRIVKTWRDRAMGRYAGDSVSSVG